MGDAACQHADGLELLRPEERLLQAVRVGGVAPDEETPPIWQRPRRDLQ